MDGRWFSHVEQIKWPELPKWGNFQKLERDLTRQEGKKVDFQDQKAELLERGKTPAKEEHGSGFQQSAALQRFSHNRDSEGLKDWDVFHLSGKSHMPTMRTRRLPNLSTNAGFQNHAARQGNLKED